MFPDIPACRYPQIADEVRAICEKHGLPYNTGRLSRQLGSTWAKIFRLALPGGGGGVDGPAITVVPAKTRAAA